MESLFFPNPLVVEKKKKKKLRNYNPSTASVSQSVTAAAQGLRITDMELALLTLFIHHNTIKKKRRKKNIFYKKQLERVELTFSLIHK